MNTEPTQEERDIWDKLKEEDSVETETCVHCQQIQEIWKALMITAVVMCLGFIVVFVV